MAGNIMAGKIWQEKFEGEIWRENFGEKYFGGKILAKKYFGQESVTILVGFNLKMFEISKSNVRFFGLFDCKLCKYPLKLFQKGTVQQGGKCNFVFQCTGRESNEICMCSGNGASL